MTEIMLRYTDVDSVIKMYNKLINTFNYNKITFMAAPRNKMLISSRLLTLLKYVHFGCVSESVYFIVSIKYYLNLNYFCTQIIQHTSDTMLIIKFSTPVMEKLSWFWTTFTKYIKHKNGNAYKPSTSYSKALALPCRTCIVPGTKVKCTLEITHTLSST